MKKMMVMIGIATLSACAFAGPHGCGGGGCRPCPPAPCRPCPPPCHRPCGGDWWGRGGRNFWPGFVGGLVGGVVANAVSTPSTTVVSQPAVVTTPVVVTQPIVAQTVTTTQNVWVEGRYVDTVQANGLVVRTWQPGHYEQRTVIVQ